MAILFGNAKGGKAVPLRSNRGLAVIGEWKVGATATNVRSGRIVRRSAAGKVQVTGTDAKDLLGFVNVRLKKNADKSRRKDVDRDADFATDDTVEVVAITPGTIFEADLASGNLTAGTRLKADSSGQLVALTSTVNAVEALIGRFMMLEDVDASGGAKPVLVVVL